MNKAMKLNDSIASYFLSLTSSHLGDSGQMKAKRNARYPVARTMMLSRYQSRETKINHKLVTTNGLASKMLMMVKARDLLSIGTHSEIHT